MLIEKDVWDLVLTSSCPIYENLGLWSKEIKEDQMAISLV